MAGETQKSTALTNAIAVPGVKVDARLGKAVVVTAQDHHQFVSVAAGLEVGDVTLFLIDLPSNAVVHSIEIYNDDMDTNACPTLAIDVGVFAAQDFTSVTSSTKTKHTVDDVLDADAYVDGSTTPQAVTTSWTTLAFDSVTFGPDDAGKGIWEVLGYDEDPHAKMRFGMTAATASATLASAADFRMKVTYSVD